jgi:maleylpyruvate isomerase
MSNSTYNEHSGSTPVFPRYGASDLAEDSATTDVLRLHGYFRSSAAWRVRIALNIKGLEVQHVFHHLRYAEQRASDYLHLNPQGLVPTLEISPNIVLRQSLAICEWLDEKYPTTSLLPGTALDRARIRAIALAIACDIHPLQNLKVLERLGSVGLSDHDVKTWARSFIDEGLRSCVSMLEDDAGRFCFGNTPTLADLCLIPQLANARRFDVDLTAVPRLLDIEAACRQLEDFRRAEPGQQGDAE